MATCSLRQHKIDVLSALLVPARQSLDKQYVAHGECSAVARVFFCPAETKNSLFLMSLGITHCFPPPSSFPSSFPSSSLTKTNFLLRQTNLAAVLEPINQFQVRHRALIVQLDMSSLKLATKLALYALLVKFRMKKQNLHVLRARLERTKRKAGKPLAKTVQVATCNQLPPKIRVKCAWLDRPNKSQDKPFASLALQVG